MPLLALSMLLATALHAADSDDFQFVLPPGWVDLADRAVDVSRYPANAVNEARNGKYRIYAIDPNNLSDHGANALMNVIEVPQTASMTSAALDRSAKETAALARARGLTWTTLGMRVAKLGEVDIGVVDSTLRTGAGTMRLVQYLIPGRNNSAALTYGCKPDEFSSYKPIFEASAMATTGAYSHSFNRRSAMKAVLIVAVVCSLLALLAISIILRGSPAPASTSHLARVSSWECPICRRRVPGRVDVCRCGAARPA